MFSWISKILTYLKNRRGEVSTTIGVILILLGIAALFFPDKLRGVLSSILTIGGTISVLFPESSSED